MVLIMFFQNIMKDKFNKKLTIKLMILRLMPINMKKKIFNLLLIKEKHSNKVLMMLEIKLLKKIQNLFNRHKLELKNMLNNFQVIHMN
jgi:hypothetical protein